MVLYKFNHTDRYPFREIYTHEHHFICPIYISTNHAVDPYKPDPSLCTCTWKQEEGLRLQLRPPTLNLIPTTPLQPLINRLFGFPILARIEPIQCIAAAIGDGIPAAFCEVAFGLFECYSCCNPTECNALVSEASGRMTRMEVKKGEGRTLL